MDAERRPRALVQTAFDERLPSLSPDGRWLAYISDETGRWEVYVQGFPEPGLKRQVSDSRGVDPVLASRLSSSERPLRWSRDGHELFYWNGDDLMSVPVTPGRGFDSGPPRVVFNEAGVWDLDTTPDGTQFLLIREIPSTPLTRIVVVLGAAAEIGRRAP